MVNETEQLEPQPSFIPEQVEVRYEVREGGTHQGQKSKAIIDLTELVGIGRFSNVYAVKAIGHKTGDDYLYKSKTASDREYIYKAYKFSDKFAEILDANGEIRPGMQLTDSETEAINQAITNAWEQAKREVIFLRLIGLHPKEVTQQKNGMPAIIMMRVPGQPVDKSGIYEASFTNRLEYFKDAVNSYVTQILPAELTLRDIKGDNLLLSEDKKVTYIDPGFALLWTEMPKPDLTSGTPAYMAPEQFNGQKITYATDIYALIRHGLELFGAAKIEHVCRLLNIPGHYKSLARYPDEIANLLIQTMFSNINEPSDYLVEKQLITSIFYQGQAKNADVRPHPEALAAAFNAIFSIHQTVNALPAEEGVNAHMQACLQYAGENSLLEQGLRQLFFTLRGKLFNNNDDKRLEIIKYIHTLIKVLVEDHGALLKTHKKFLVKQFNIYKAALNKDCDGLINDDLYKALYNIYKANKVEEAEPKKIRASYQARQSGKHRNHVNAAIINLSEPALGRGSQAKVRAVEKINHNDNGVIEHSTHEYVYKQYTHISELKIYANARNNPRYYIPHWIRNKLDTDVEEAQKTAMQDATKERLLLRLTGMHPKQLIRQPNGMPAIIMLRGPGIEVATSNLWVASADNPPAPFTQRVRYFARLAETYAKRYYLNGVVNHDIKAENILYDTATNTVTLIDPGLGKKAEEVTTQVGGTIEYASPEQFLAQNTTFATDIWAMARHGFEVFGAERTTTMLNISMLGRFSLDDLKPIQKRIVNKHQQTIFQALPENKNDFAIEKTFIKAALAPGNAYASELRPHPEVFAQAFAGILTFHELINAPSLNSVSSQLSMALQFMGNNINLTQSLKDLLLSLEKLMAVDNEQQKVNAEKSLQLAKYIHGLIRIFSDNEVAWINQQKPILWQDFKNYIDSLRVDALDVWTAIPNELCNELSIFYSNNEKVAHEVQVATTKNKIEYSTLSKVDLFYEQSKKYINSKEHPDLVKAINALKSYSIDELDEITKVLCREKADSPAYKRAEARQAQLLELAVETKETTMLIMSSSRHIETNEEKTNMQIGINEKQAAIYNLEQLADKWFTNKQKIFHAIGRVVHIFTCIAVGMAEGAFVGAVAGFAITPAGTIPGAVVGALVGGVVAAVASWKTGGLLFPNPATAVVKQMAEAHNKAVDDEIAKSTMSAAAAAA